MSAQRVSEIAKHACLRCKDRKRKCDKALPSCSLCERLRQACKYDNTPISPVRNSQVPENAFSPHHIKDAIVQKLLNFTREDVVTIYLRTLQPWFAFIPEERLSGEFPNTWNDASVDVTLLAFTILLFNAQPLLLEGSYRLQPDTMLMYLSIKSWLALLEGAGLNSIGLVYSRLLNTLFEVVHGFHPAAYLSIAATVRAADALSVYDENRVPLLSSLGSIKEREERRDIWCGIMILDRYLAVENGKFPPVTRGRNIPDYQNQFDRNAEMVSSSFHGSFEASCLLDKVHIAIYEPTLEQSFNIEEITMILGALSSLQTIVAQDMVGKSRLSSSGLAFATTGLLLIFENGAKPTIDGRTSQCREPSIAIMANLLDDILKLLEELDDSVVFDVQNFSPFVLHLIYKAGAIITERLQVGIDLEMNLRKVRIFRKFLKFMSQKWLAGERYLELLNEDTAPRILKAIECDD
ncbi:hypothetical protein ACHAQE_011285 [Botrytis cinerea]